MPTHDETSSIVTTYSLLPIRVEQLLPGKPREQEQEVPTAQQRETTIVRVRKDL